jgi:undecaprenyl diphosphate synthase
VWKMWFGKKNSLNELTANYQELIPDNIPRHIAIIMDGNGRWAQNRGLPRTLGHRSGVEALRSIVSAASELGVGILTVYAFSTENWKRPAEEVALLMKLFSEYLDNEINELHENEVQIRFIGNTRALAVSLQRKIERAEKLTAANTGLILNIAVNYGGRAELVRAVQFIAEKVLSKEIVPSDITETTISQQLYNSDLPDPDLIIRPSGDKRISNFLIWQAAYAELWFTNVNWPDFTADHLVQAIHDFQQRERRFGGLKNMKK